LRTTSDVKQPVSEEYLMPIAATLDEAPRHRLDQYSTTESWLIKGDVLVDPSAPSCKLVEQDPQSTVHPHFHHVPQFQVIVKGNGSLGKTDVRPLVVHYAAAYTPYGPIVTRDGLDYFVARDGVDKGAGWMPQERATLPAVPRRHRVADWVPQVSPAQLAAGTDLSDVSLIPLEDDGLATWLFRLAPEQRWAGPDPKDGGGQFHLIATGGVTYLGREYYRLTCLYAAPHEAPLELVAGAKGAEILTMQFPRHADSP
jgi:hypothetical protein